MQSSRGRLMLVALFGVLALSAVTAVAAQAVEAPRWSTGGAGKILGAGETHFITAKAYSANFKLKTGNVTVTCTEIKLREGSLLGTAAGNGGANNEVIEFKNCTVSGTAGGKPIEKCKVNEPIVTNPVRSELVETEKGVPGTSGSLLTLFEPAVGATFLTVSFTTETGGNCPPGTHVTGKMAGQVLTDPENGTLGKLVELPKVNSAEAKSWLINFPNIRITRVGRIKGGVLTEENISLEASSEPATVEGTALVLLAKRETNGELVSDG